MKLYISPSSPFARKVRIVAHEKGLADRIEEILVDPYANAPELLASNPVVQVPTLIAEDGVPISDSPVIAQYLDRLGTGAALIPDAADMAAWLEVKRRETFANHALEMGVKLVLEKRRPEEERSPLWIRRWTENLLRTLDVLDDQNQQAQPLDIAVITTGAVLAWLNLRHPDLDWKTGRPKLVALQAKLETLPSFVDTYPR